MYECTGLPQRVALGPLQSDHFRHMNCRDHRRCRERFATAISIGNLTKQTSPGSSKRLSNALNLNCFTAIRPTQNGNIENTWNEPTGQENPAASRGKTATSPHEFAASHKVAQERCTICTKTHHFWHFADVANPRGQKLETRNWKIPAAPPAVTSAAPSLQSPVSGF